jgi:hypothetical protein
VGTVLTATAASLAADVDRILAGAGLQAPPRLPTGHPVGDGYAIEQMPQCGPVRVAVRWHHAGPRWSHPGPWTDCTDLDLCRTALTTAGYRVEIIHATVTYIAVLPPPGS